MITITINGKTAQAQILDRVCDYLAPTFRTLNITNSAQAVRRMALISRKASLSFLLISRLVSCTAPGTSVPEVLPHHPHPPLPPLLLHQHLLSVWIYLRPAGSRHQLLHNHPRRLPPQHRPPPLLQLLIPLLARAPLVWLLPRRPLMLSP